MLRSTQVVHPSAESCCSSTDQEPCFRSLRELKWLSWGSALLWPQDGLGSIQANINGLAGAICDWHSKVGGSMRLYPKIDWAWSV